MAHAAKTVTSDVERRPAAIRYAWGLLADVAPGRDLVGELIADHRAEARAEDEDDAREGTGRGGLA